MARPVEYDLDTVLNKAMELFWEKGYENISMDQLVTQTGLNRRTMYSLFKDKNGLFKDSLDNYYLKISSNVIKILIDNPGKEGIKLFLNRFTFNDNFKGCLFNNCMGKGNLMEEEAFNIPKEYFNKLRKQIEKNLDFAKTQKEFSGDSKAVALTIMTIIHGFNVFGKYNNSKEDSQLIMQTVLNLIK